MALTALVSASFVLAVLVLRFSFTTLRSIECDCDRAQGTRTVNIKRTTWCDVVAYGEWFFVGQRRCSVLLELGAASLGMDCLCASVIRYKWRL